MKYWFLSVLFFIKIIHVILERRGLNVILWTTALIVSLCFYDSLPLFVTRLANSGFFFHMGYLARTQNYISADKCPRLFYGVLLLAAGPVVSALSSVCPAHFIAPVSALCSCLGLFTIFYSLKISHPVFMVSGLYSMVIYCLHTYANAFLNVMRLPSHIPFPAVLYVIHIAAGIVLPLLAVWLYKKCWCFRWIEYFFYPGKILKP